MKKKLSILVVDDEKRVVDEIVEFLKGRKYKVFSATNSETGLNILKTNDIDLAILDIKMEGMDGLELLKKTKELKPSVEVIMISGHGDMTTVIEAMRLGASDYFQKPFRLIDINNAITRTKRFLALNEELKSTKENLDFLSEKLLENIGAQLIGNSSSLKKMIGMMQKVAQTDNTSVLILGESGTGKELVAHGIHYLSRRNRNTFYSVNCSAIPESLFESEFFGHKKGAFTGALTDKEGWFEIADKGTLFLDEISDMPLDQQAKLLRVLEERKVSKVGSRESKKVDVRVIAASNKNLEALTHENKFRLDLFHRLSIFVIEIPPLRERKEDIPLLLDYYVKIFASRMGKNISGIDVSAVNKLMNYQFPGNVRELRNFVERAVIMCDGELLTGEHFIINNGNRDMQQNNESAGVVSKPDSAETHETTLNLKENEKRLIIKALEMSNYQKSKAAELLGITWQALDRRMKRFNITF